MCRDFVHVSVEEGAVAETGERARSAQSQDGSHTDRGAPTRPASTAAAVPEAGGSGLGKTGCRLCASARVTQGGLGEARLKNRTLPCGVGPSTGLLKPLTRRNGNR